MQTCNFIGFFCPDRNNSAFIILTFSKCPSLMASLYEIPTAVVAVAKVSLVTRTRYVLMRSEIGKGKCSPYTGY